MMLEKKTHIITILELERTLESTGNQFRIFSYN